MDQFVRFLEMALLSGRLLHIREFRRVRDSFTFAIAVAAVFVLPGAFLGYVSWGYKLAWIELGMVVTTYYLLRLAYHRAPFGAEVGLAYEALRSGPATDKWLAERLARHAANGAEDYLRFIAGLLASELAALLIALWIPAHQDPLAALLILPTAMVLITYWIWQKGQLWWPKFVFWFAVATMAVAIAAVILPYTILEIASRQGFLDDGLSAFIRGDAAPKVAFWVLVALAVARFFLLTKVPTAYQTAVRRGSFWLLVALAASWFIWGQGFGVIGGVYPTATPFKGVSRIEVPLAGGRPVPVDRLVRGGWCYTIRRGTAENLRLVFADSSTPQLFGQKYVGWREIRALVADSGTAAIEVWPPTRGSCNPDDAAR